jgi:signal transduction histidine kinase
MVGTLAVVIEGLLRAPAGLSPVAYGLALVAGAPLAIRTRAPLSALLGVETGALACAIVLHASWTATALVLIELYTVALLGHRRRSVLIGALTAVGVTIAIVIVDGSIDPQGVATRLPLVFLALAIGDTLRSRHTLRLAAQERADREALERERELRRRSAAERLQMARELHDTLGHSLVAINVRAGVAIDLADSQDDVTALDDIKHVSAGALSDLRATLTLLRDANEGAPTAPIVDLSGLPGLVRHARAAGLQTDVEIDLGTTSVPAAISGAAFRIVQEALTNVLRHANAARANVTVRARSGALDIEVTDDGICGGVTGDRGFGLRGMAERAAALGGRLDAGRCDGGGWRVHAMLPLTERAAR